MRFEDSHVERMKASCTQREDGNISPRVRIVIRGSNVSEASYNVFTKPATFDRWKCFRFSTCSICLSILYQASPGSKGHWPLDKELKLSRFAYFHTKQ